VTRWGLNWPTKHHQYDEPKDSPFSKHYWPKPEEIALGRKRARAGMLLMLALPGSAYIWQGQELGLEEVRDIPDHERQDPEFINSHGEWIGRDGCRVPIPWTKAGKTFGFGPEDGKGSWLTQPKHWGELSVEAQQSDPDSMWHLTRSALMLRRTMEVLGSGDMRWRDDLTNGDENVIAYERIDANGIAGLVCVANLSDKAITIPASSVLLTSLPEMHLEHGHLTLPQDSSAWVLL
jgi:alpha-glucosidase